MKVKLAVDDDQVAFEFIKMTNLKSENDMYMHNVTYHFVDKHTLKAEWTIDRLLALDFVRIHTGGDYVEFW